MNDTDGAESEAVSFEEVLFDDGLHIARRDGVEIEDVGDGDANWFAGVVHKFKSPAPRTGPGQDYLYCAHLMSSDRMLPGMAHDRFHLIFQAEFQFFEPRFFQLFLFGQMGMRLKLIQLVSIL